MPNENKIYKQIGERIRHMRVTKGISQENLAYEANLNRAYIGYIERGERHPSIATVNKIARVLKTPLYQLFIKK